MNKKTKINDFKQGDFLTFKASDGKYKVIFCISAYKERSPYNFYFAATNCSTENKPTVQDILESEFFGIGNRKSDYLKYTDNELHKMWLYHPEIKPYSLGAYNILIYRKEFMQMRENFEFITNIPIINNLDKNGNSGWYPGNILNINNFFIKDLVELMNQRGQYPFKLKAIL